MPGVAPVAVEVAVAVTGGRLIASRWQVLDIDLDWRMHKVSDGQRRRVQICMGLLKQFQVRLAGTYANRSQYCIVLDCTQEPAP